MIQELRVSCKNCSLGVLCVPRGLDPEDIPKLDSIIQHKKILQRGEFLYHANEPFGSLYALKSGAVKIISYDEFNNEHIQGLYLTGELIGFDALATDKHCCSVVALETCHVCEIPTESLDCVNHSIPSLHRQLLRHIGRKINTNETQIVVNKASAEIRLVTFLLNLSNRFAARGFSPFEFSIYLTRQEIGNYLNLTTETVSRLMRSLDREGIIQLHQKRIRITDMPKLKSITVSGINL